MRVTGLGAPGEAVEMCAWDAAGEALRCQTKAADKAGTAMFVFGG